CGIIACGDPIYLGGRAAALAGLPEYFLRETRPAGRPRIAEMEGSNGSGTVLDQADCDTHERLREISRRGRAAVLVVDYPHRFALGSQPQHRLNEVVAMRGNHP